MCTTCGCGADHEHAPDHVHGHGHDHDHDHDHAHRTIRFERDLLAKNAKLAAENRRRFAEQRVAIFNLIGSPGAGKTALLEAVIRRLQGTLPLGVIEGDQATDYDAKRIERAGGRALQINTGTGCHLDASMIESGVRGLDVARESVVFVENVGNLVCPALFDLGERAKVVVMSVTEGEDKPRKYPHIFRAAQLFVLTKIDLQPMVQLDQERCFALARQVNPDLQMLRVSATNGQGIDAFCTWIQAEATRAWRGVPRETTVAP
jgi:hydrogenase nickel incorporation protein HypB